MITSDHPEWPEFKTRVLLEPIVALRSELENVNLTHEQTAAIRGEIAALRRILNDIEPTAHEAAPRTYS